MSDSFRIGVREFQSRLMVGTGKYANDQLAIDAIRESERISSPWQSAE